MGGGDEPAWLGPAAAALVARPDAAELVRFLFNSFRTTGLNEQLLSGPRALLRFAIEQGIFDPRAETVVATRTVGVETATEVGIFVVPAITGRPDIIEELHAAGARFKPGRLDEPSPLHYAARHASSATCSVVAPLVHLVKVDPNGQRGTHGQTPLEIACRHLFRWFSAKFAVALLENGASAKGQHIVLLLAGKCVPEAVDVLKAIMPWLTPEELNECGPMSPLALAIHDRHLEFADTLMATGSVDVNALGSKNGSALYHAATWADYAWAKQLLEAGADPNTGISPLYGLLVMADRRVYGFDYTERIDDVVRMLKLLLDHGADLNAAPVLAVAARRGLAPVVDLLLDSGADPNRDAGRPNEEHTPLIAAAGGPSPDPAIVKRLVLSGATAARAQRPADFPGPWFTAHTPMTQFTSTLMRRDLRGPCAWRDNSKGYLRARAEIYAMLAAAGDSVAEAVERVGQGGANTRVAECYINGHSVPQTPYHIAASDHDDVMVDMLTELDDWPTWTTVALYAPERIAQGFLRSAHVSSSDVHHALAKGGSPIAVNAAKCWAPPRHRYFHNRHATTIELVLLCAARAAHGTAEHAYLARAPREVWYAIFAWLGRDGWGVV